MSEPRHEAGDEETPFYKPGRIRPVSQLAPLIGNALGRVSTPLHGAWQFIVDQADLGDSSPMMHGGVGCDERHGPDELLEYSFDGNDSLQVPGDWNTQRPELFWYRGVIWYRREFDWQPRAAQRLSPNRTFLYFGGANFRKDIYLNGALLARHAGGFTPFNIEVTEYLRAGRNALTVKVDSRSGADEVPTEYNDWLNYGGLTREVLLLELPASFVRNYKIQFKRDSSDVITGWVQLDGAAAAGAEIELSIAEAGIQQRLRADAQGRAHFEFLAALQRWSPALPKRYEVCIAACGDEVREHLGFRTLEVRGEDILLNDEAVFLRGISMHEERLRRPGRAWGAADAAESIAEIQALNANFVRLAHYPHDEHLVRACEAAGILIWAELPVYQSIAFANPDTLASAQRQYADLIARDQNRAAVILWSVANETADTAPRNAFLCALAGQVRALDDTRLVTAALLGNDEGRRMAAHVGAELLARRSGRTLPLPRPMRVDDSLGEHLDVLACNEYLGWYSCGFLARSMRAQGHTVSERELRDLMLEMMPAMRIETAWAKPLIVSEFGGEAVQGLRGAETGIEHGIFSEDYQARLYQAQLAMLGACTAVRGLSPWILKDFRAPYRLHTRLQQYWNRKGLVSEHGLRKLAFAVLAAHYRERSRGEG